MNLNPQVSVKNEADVLPVDAMVQERFEEALAKHNADKKCETKAVLKRKTLNDHVIECTTCRYHEGVKVKKTNFWQFFGVHCVGVDHYNALGLPKPPRKAKGTTTTEELRAMARADPSLVYAEDKLKCGLCDFTFKPISTRRLECNIQMHKNGKACKTESQKRKRKTAMKPGKVEIDEEGGVKKPKPTHTQQTNLKFNKTTFSDFQTAVAKPLYERKVAATSSTQLNTTTTTSTSTATSSSTHSSRSSTSSSSSTPGTKKSISSNQSITHTTSSSSTSSTSGLPQAPSLN